ncbi:TIGR00730 family Rossman fold protein [Iamia majanohamensis]|uniref:TIGR00730 family Rossman fold protein n=1 Tax=Iamia majanohamensis TaxID=467976 RepID=A0AAE9YE62_9ACTN|nr:TIGR00730 family Rossman fold protein [Iamia majanohamensis]WCO69179.1 TIGR00730 family Rossman fold protein [Iamia majanohamensis]
MAPDPLPDTPAAPDPVAARLSDDLAPEVEEAVGTLMDAVGDAEEADLIRAIVRTAALLGRDDTERLDLKIVRAAVAEMREAFAVFAPYRHVPKVTIFGSARTRAGSPLYLQARRIAAELADAGWMVITGAGPGIMQAGMEGAGRDMSIGVNIRLPFEQDANDVITGDPKLVTMKYFFTRKLMLIKESAGFVALPGGFGTIDETMELLTLQQTGKAVPAPVIMLDEPGGSYWEGWARFVTEDLVAGGYVRPEDVDLADRTDDVAVATGLITGFYRRYHSIRWVGTRLVIRTLQPVSDEDLEDLNARFGHLCAEGGIERATPFSPERDDDDHLDLPRLACTYDVHQMAGLHHLVRAVNATGG